MIIKFPETLSRMDRIRAHLRDDEFRFLLRAELEYRERRDDFSLEHDALAGLEEEILDITGETP